MDRVIVYPGAIPQDTDLLSPQRNAMIALGYLARATLGTSTVVDGLACTQTTVASMSIVVAPGSITSLTTIDPNAYGSLAADSTDPLVKMGINIASTTLGPMTAPSTAGQSVVYLVQAAFSETDTGSLVLPYYNSSNPSSPYSGPANAGTAQNTKRAQTVTLQLKQGTAATTGSQTTPAPDNGYIGLYAITIANGQSTITSANIATLSTAPFIPYKLPSLTPGFGVIGQVRNAKMSVTTAGTSATFTADEIVVGTALGGLQTMLASYSQTVSLATTGAGGMDTGSAPTSGFVALYAIYGSAGTSILAVNATSSAAPTVYGGSNMPTGYIYSALISVWPTNGSGQFVACDQRDRLISTNITSILSTNSVVSYTSLSISNAVPLNAVSCNGLLSISVNATSQCYLTLSPHANLIGSAILGFGEPAAGGFNAQISFTNLTIATPQTLYYTTNNSNGTPTFAASITGYTF